MRLGLSRRGKRMKKGTVIFLMVSFSAFLICYVIYSLQPAFFEYAQYYANNIANSVVDESVSEVFSKGEYQSFLREDGETGENTSVIETDTSKANRLKADINRSIQESIENRRYYTVYVPLGSITHLYFFAGIGPNIPIKIYPVSIVSTDFNETFDSVGINQVYHKLCLDVSIQMSFAGFAYSKTETVTTSALLTETIIMGETPEYYGGVGALAAADVTE